MRICGLDQGPSVCVYLFVDGVEHSFSCLTIKHPMSGTTHFYSSEKQMLVFIVTEFYL